LQLDLIHYKPSIFADGSEKRKIDVRENYAKLSSGLINKFSTSVVTFFQIISIQITAVIAKKRMRLRQSNFMRIDRFAREDKKGVIAKESQPSGRLWQSNIM